MKKGRKRIKDYAPVVQAQLDLHGCTAHEAEVELKDFLEQAIENKWVRVRIVVGKGIHSEGGIAVLPDTVKNILSQLGYTYTYAKLQNGGEGALEVAL